MTSWARGSRLARLNRTSVHVGHAIANLDQHRAKTTGPDVAECTLCLKIERLLGIEAVLGQNFADVGSVHVARILLLYTVLHWQEALAKSSIASGLGESRPRC